MDNSNRILSFLINDYETKTQRSCPYSDLSEIVQEWLLYKVVPVEFCFDGVNYEMNFEETIDKFKYLCTFWYLNGGKSLTAALDLKLWIENNQLTYKMLITSECEFSSYDKMWKTLYLAKDNDFEDWQWTHEYRGSIVI